MNIFEKIMKRLEEESDYEPIEYDCDDTGCVDEQKFIATDEAKKIVQEVAEEHNNCWIPCSERLPNKDEYLKNDGRFIVTDGNRIYQSTYDIYTNRFRTVRIHPLLKTYDFPEDKNVIAWQQFPEYTGRVKINDND